ncbi:MAG: universal stress protein [Desulforhopalus sp.]
MDRKIHNVLVCVDFSDYTAMVMEYVVELAKDWQILVYSVINERDVNIVDTVTRYVPGNVNVADYIENLKQEREAMVRELIGRYLPEAGSNVTLAIDVGIPSEQILKIIEDREVDLVIMANKGKGSITRVLFGSAADKVFKHSPVPVISVREPKHHERKNH